MGKLLILMLLILVGTCFLKELYYIEELSFCTLNDESFMKESAGLGCIFFAD